MEIAVKKSPGLRAAPMVLCGLVLGAEEGCKSMFRDREVYADDPGSFSSIAEYGHHSASRYFNLR